MSTHQATITWNRETEDFAYDTFNRNHTWSFPNGQSLRASSAPDYLGDPACVDPEEGLAASASACHMLTFLAIASKKRYVVERYTDEATACLGTNEDGAMAVTRIELRPRIVFGGDRRPDSDGIAAIHEKAHKHCFIANSIRAEVVVLESAASD